MKDRDTSAQTLREMNDDQLAAILRDACTKLFRMKVQSKTDRLEVPSELRRNRRLVARIKTIQGERLRATQPQNKPAN